MATSTRPETEWTVADLYRRFGPIPAWRIRQIPPPGTATVADVAEIHDREKRACELIDGILVEKAVGLYESLIACAIIEMLRAFIIPRKLGAVSGESGMMEIAPDLVRIPDVSFISWDRFPNRRVSRDPVPRLVPDLAVEVLSKGNTKKEMDEKLDDYFATGVRLVWLVDPVKRTVRVYTGRHESRLLRENHTLDGGDVLPGLEIIIRSIFEDVPIDPPANEPGPVRQGKNRPG